MSTMRAAILAWACMGCLFSGGPILAVRTNGQVTIGGSLGVDAIDSQTLFGVSMGVSSPLMARYGHELLDNMTVDLAGRLTRSTSKWTADPYADPNAPTPDPYRYLVTGSSALESP